MNYYKKKIRLAVIFDQLLKTGGGYQQALNVSININKSNDIYEQIYFTTYSQNISILKEYGLEVNHIKISKINRAWLKLRSFIYSEFFLKIIQQFIGFNKFEKYLLDKNIDLVYFLSPSNWSNYLENLNFIITIWDLCHRDELEFPEVYKNRIFERRDISIEKSLKRAVAIIADSELGRSNIVSRYLVDKSRVYVAPFLPSFNISNSNFVINKSIKEKFHISRDYIFYPAQFWAHKNHIYILQGIKILKEKYNTNIDVVFAGGDAGNLEHVKKTSEELNLSKQVHFLGFINNEDLFNLYKQSIALVMPTFFGPTNIPPLEAFALGVPVLYSDLPGLKEQVGEAALLLNLDNPDSMATHLLSLLNDKNLRKNLIDLGKKRININNNYFEIVSLICSKFQIKMQTWK